MIDLAVQNIQQAALPWAGVCIGLQILSNPGKATRSNLEGIAHVIARMDWYCALAEHLLDEDSIDVGNKSFGAVLQQLEERVISLYKTLLLYQMKSVRSYYRNSTLVFLRGLANLDDWDSDLKRITDAEDDVKADSDQFVRQHTRKALAALMKNSIEMKEQLGDICQTLQDLMTAQKEARRDDIEMACRRDLRVLDPQDDMDRIEKNKDKLFDDAYRWVFDTQEYAAFTNWDDGSPDFSSRRLLWIRGNAGTGKSMLMIGIIRELSRQPAFLAAKLSFFFCEGMDVALKTATAVLRSLMWLLLVQQPHLISHLLEEYKGSGADLFNDRNAFIALSKAFFSMIEDPQLSAVYFVVDALDECGEGQSDLIDLISKSLDHSEKVKWLVSSRPTVSLKNQHIAGTILGLDARNLARPVAAYIDYKLSFLGGRDGYDERTLIRIADAIRQGANNTFLWVALVFKELESVEGWYAEDIIAQIPSDLSELYSHIMRGIEKGRMRDPEYCKNALVAVSLAYRPLSLCELSVVAGLPSKIDPQNIVEKCGSFLIVNGKIVEPVHQSAKEYLIKHQKRGVAPGHVDISRRSIHAMSSMLVKNSYSLSFRRNTKGMQPPDLDLAPVLYSCVFWARHLCFDNDHGPSSECRQDLTDEGPVFKFLGEFFLRWVEILSLIELLSDGAESIRKLLRIAQSQPDVSCALVSFLQDAERFIRSHGSIIDRAPLQIYGSAILFTPTTSEVRKKLWHQRLQFIKNPQGIIDDSRVQVLEGHSGHVCCVAFSPVSEILASGGSYDCEIRLWNTGTGVQKQILKGHTDWVRAVVFSPDGNTLASASSDNTVRLWHVATGTQKRALEGYGAWAIAFSPDGKILALASNGVRLLDAETGTYVKTLGDAKAKVIAFSPNGKRLASASENVVELWDLTTALEYAG
ncbi:Vegetative incompatibility protein HET-E-1 [Pleurostoma richardsiae]|uniref:Vegetative incompatibility protein HET-E-1 n=1 Tax=Pleurostoma richardsiae TaxID=41990 RepID=A0AA38R6Z5_9PEZI|nr:Vegetative incompatibility protein HET-E-1 [Pleurostoma richardsiae]